MTKSSFYTLLKELYLRISKTIIMKLGKKTEIFKKKIVNKSNPDLLLNNFIKIWENNFYIQLQYCLKKSEFKKST